MPPSILMGQLGLKAYFKIIYCNICCSSFPPLSSCTSWNFLIIHVPLLLSFLGCGPLLMSLMSVRGRLCCWRPSSNTLLIHTSFRLAGPTLLFSWMNSSTRSGETRGLTRNLRISLTLHWHWAHWQGSRSPWLYSRVSIKWKTCSAWLTSRW